MPEAVFLFDHRRGTREEQFRVITPGGEDYAGQYAALFSEADVALMVAEADRYRWPESKPFPLADLEERLEENPGLLDAWNDRRLFTATTPKGEVQLVQVRRDPAVEDGTETSAGKYVSWHYTDNGWMRGEPDGPLAFSCGHFLAHAAGATIFVHEGASTPHRLYEAISKVDRGEPSFLDDHPFRDDILGAVHIGYLGGAGWPQRADWDTLRVARPGKVVLVPDNDDPGRGAVNFISRRLAGMKCTWVQFTGEFEVGFDLSDAIPEKFYEVNEDGGRVYKLDSPRFQDLVHPASWLTRELPPPLRPEGQRGRPPALKYGLRLGAADNWTFVEQMGKFYDLDRPWRLGVDAPTLNRILHRFSDVDDVARLISKAQARTVHGLTYRPDMPQGLVSEDNLVKLNQYQPSPFQPAETASTEDLRPFTDLLEHLFPVEEERHEVSRWLATLYARPERRMHYGMLVQSQTQGSGKTTLGEVIARLVGPHNASFPSESEVVDSDFNSWKAGRVVIVNEIYGGQGWTAYNRLKDAVTDPKVRINEKNEKRYQRRAFAHFYCCSNSPKALQIAHGDRRWFIPRVREKKFGDILKGDRRAVEFYRWIDGPGIPLIARWALEFEKSGEGMYVEAGAEAPETERKKEQIEDSYTEVQKFAIDVFERMAAGEREAVVGAHEIIAAAKLIWPEAKDKPAAISELVGAVPGVVVRPGRMRHGDKKSAQSTYSIRNLKYGEETGFVKDFLFDLKVIVEEYRSAAAM